MTPLNWAVRADSARIAKWLLSKGDDVDARTVTGRTGLHLARNRVIRTWSGCWQDMGLLIARAF